MTSVVHTVVAEFADAAEAEAFAQIARELGVSVTTHSRTLNTKPRTPMRDQRLGLLVLAEMRREPRRWWSAGDFESLAKREHYSPRSIGPVLSVLASEGDVERVGHGQYRLVGPTIEG